MVMNFERLSSNVITIIAEVLKNQKLVNYLGWNGDHPSAKSIVPSTIAPKGANERILPYPFDTSYKADVRSQLHIYYPSMVFENNGNAGVALVVFDIVVHKSIWLLTDADKRVIRPYQVANFIMQSFKGKSIEGLGELHFIKADHTVINEQFEGFRLVARITEF
jgi:hypothetical protein